MSMESEQNPWFDKWAANFLARGIFNHMLKVSPSSVVAWRKTFFSAEQYPSVILVIEPLPPLVISSVMERTGKLSH